MPIVTQRQVPQFLTVAKVVEVPPLQFIGRFVDVPVIMPVFMPLMQRHFPQIQTVVKTRKSCPCRSSADLWACL